MTTLRPHLAKLAAALLGGALLLPGGGSALAGNGGVEYQQGGGVEYGSTSADGSFLSSRRGGLAGRTLRVRGTLAGTQPGQTVQLQRLDRRTGWSTVATAVVGDDGFFETKWTPRNSGRTALRAVAASESGSAQAAASGPVRELTVFKPAIATWYGPGFYGRRTACGRRMTRTLVGVAHRSLPCGTLVDVYYKGRTLRIPVVDRGPYDNGASWDLTAAAAETLGFTHTATIGALRVARG